MLLSKTGCSTHHLHVNYNISCFHLRALTNSSLFLELNSAIIRAYFPLEKVVWQTINPPAIRSTQHHWCFSYQLARYLNQFWNYVVNQTFLQPIFFILPVIPLVNSMLEWLESCCVAQKPISKDATASFPFGLTRYVNRIWNHGVNLVILQPICILLQLSPLVNSILD